MDFACTARVVQLVAQSLHILSIASSNPARVTSRPFFWKGRLMHTPVNTAVRAVVRSPGKAAPLGGVVLAGKRVPFFVDFVSACH